MGYKIKQILIFAVLIIIFSSAKANPDLSNLISILENMPEGNWEKINLNLYSDVWTPKDLRPLKGSKSIPKPEKIIQAWSSFA